MNVTITNELIAALCAVLPYAVKSAEADGTEQARQAIAAARLAIANAAIAND